MEEEKAAAYYDELTRKGSGAARFKQGLGFSSTSNDAVPSKGSALPSSSSLSTFVKASTPQNSQNLDKQSQLLSIQTKLKSKSPHNQSPPIPSPNSNRPRNSKPRSRSGSRSRSRSPSRSRGREISKNSKHRSRSRSPSRSRGRETSRNSKHRSRSGSPTRSRGRETSRNSKHRSRSRSRGRDRNSKHRSRSRSLSLERDIGRNSKRGSRSQSGSRDKYSRRKSGSRERYSRRRSRSGSRERDLRRKRSREKDSRRRRSRSRSRSKSRGDEGRERMGRRRNETSSRGRNERNGGVDYSKLIQGYDKMAPAERVKAKMKFQLTETAKKDPTRGTGSGWERFDFDKDATLDDEEIEAAEDDSSLVNHLGKSFRFSAVEARKEDQIKAAHDEAMFGAPSLQLTSEIDEEKEDSPKCTNDSSPDTSLISNQVISMQQMSWRDRVKKM